jgi:ERCC4-type nuclease
MTLYVTTAINDADLLKALGSMAIPLPIPCGDVNFTGVGIGGKDILIVCERKKPGDLSQCIADGRYLNQAQSAKDAGADVLVIIVEAAQLRSNPDDGLLEQLNWGRNPKTGHRCQVWEPVLPSIAYSRFDQYLTELAYLLGVIVKRTANVQETAAVIKALWANFQRPPDEHNSMHSIYTTPLQGTLLVKPSLVRRVAAELPGIGWAWSKSVLEKFTSVRDMVDASVDDWAGLTCENNGKKRRLGTKVANRVVEALHKKGAR